MCSERENDTAYVSRMDASQSLKEYTKKLRVIENSIIRDQTVKSVLMILVYVFYV